jgi:hypothetical protein
MDDCFIVFVASPHSVCLGFDAYSDACVAPYIIPCKFQSLSHHVYPMGKLEYIYLFIYSSVLYLTTLFSNEVRLASNKSVIIEWLNWKDLEVIGRGLIVRNYTDTHLEWLSKTTKTHSG